MYQNNWSAIWWYFASIAPLTFFMTLTEWMVWPQCGPVRPTARGNYNNVEKDRWDEVISGKFLAHLLEFTPGQLSSLYSFRGEAGTLLVFFFVSFQSWKLKKFNLETWQFLCKQWMTLTILLKVAFNFKQNLKCLAGSDSKFWLYKSFK